MVHTLLDNRYQPAKVLGEGAMGQVLLVEDTLTRQHLALKIISQATGVSEKSVLQFQQEFRLMTRLRHPNCCAVTSYGALGDGSPYFTMEVVPGHGLDELTPLEPQRFRDVFAQLMLALGYVHQQGFVHRDLKPANVRVKPDGTVKLMDFGLMEHTGRAGGPIVGTVPYLSPEIVKRGAVDARADLYSAGALAYELLTGQPPFVRPTPMEVLRAHVSELPPPPSSRRPGLGAELDALVMKLLAKEPVDRYQSAYDVLEAMGFEAPAGIGGALLSASLVGRTPELDALAAGLGAVATGQAVAPRLVWGSEGTGKTRLLEELRFQAELAGVPFVMGKAYESGNFPYRHFVWILKSLLPAMRQRMPEDLDRLAPVLVKLLPELGVAPAPEIEPTQEKLRLFAAVNDAMLTLAGKQGYVVALENWQWAEPLSIELLEHLLRNLGDAPIFLLVSSRLPHTGAQGGLASVERLALAPLDRGDLGRMVASMLGTPDADPGFVAQVAGLTEGNPLFVEHLLEHLVKTGRLQKVGGRWDTALTLSSADVPGGLAGLLSENLAQLSPAATSLARSAAVLGQVFELEDLRRVADRPDEELFDALEELTRLAILNQAHGGTYGFAQASFQTFFYAQVEPEERLAQHARALSALEVRLGDVPLAEAPLELVSQLARHALIAGVTDKAIAYALEAGQRSARLFANADAEEFLLAGLRQVQAAGGDRHREAKLGFLRTLGDVRRLTNQQENASAAYEEAIALAGELGDDASLGPILVSRAKAFQSLGKLPEALEAAERGRDASLRVGALGDAARALLTSARIRYYQGEAKGAMADAEAALARAREGADTIQQGSALGFLGYLYVGAGRSAEGITALREAVGLYEELGDRMGLHTTLDYLVNAQIMRGEFQDAEGTLARKQEIGRAMGERVEVAYGQVNQALVALERGHFREADRLAQDGVAMATKEEVAIGLAFALLEEALAAAHLGQARRAAKQAQASEQKAEAIANQYLWTELLPLRVGLAVFEGDEPAARRYLDRLTAISGESGALASVLIGEVAALGGKHEEALAAFTRAHDAAKAAEAEGQRLRALIGQTRARVALNQWEAAETSATEALSVAERLGADALAAEARGLMGEVMLGMGKKGAADQFAMMAQLADVCASPVLKAQALFGLAASSPYGPEAAGRVKEAQELLQTFVSDRDAEDRARFLAVRERKRIIDGNHIAFSISRFKQRDTGPLPPPGMWKMM